MCQESVYNCSLCSERFSLSVALIIHKMHCHSWETNEKPANLFTFIEDLIKVETKYLSDEDFDYTFIVKTSVTQTAKQIKAEQLYITDIMPDEQVDLIQQTFDLLPATPNEQDSKEGNHILGLVVDFVTKEDQTETFELTPQEYTIEFEENSLESEQVNGINSSIQADDKLFEENQDQCPLCRRTIFFYNLRRHLRNVHNLSKSQINKMNLNARFKCLVCSQMITKLNIKHHFKVNHNISDSREVERLNVVVKLSVIPYEDEKSKPIDHHKFVGCTLCTKKVLSMNLKRHLRTHKLNDSEIKSNLQQRIDANQGTSESAAELREMNEKVNLIRRRKRCYVCTLCEEEFTIRALIMQHFASNHSETIAQLTDVEFGCDLCSTVLSSFANFETHQNEHIFKPDRRKFLCNYCGTCLYSKTSLNIHIAGHLNLRQFICDICHRTKNDRNSLLIHMIRHTSEKPHKCPVKGCKAAYSLRAKLREHHILHHTTEKLHQCEICSKKFKLKKYLKLHSYTHTGYQEFSCNTCNLILPSKNSLKSHRRIAKCWINQNKQASDD